MKYFTLALFISYLAITPLFSRDSLSLESIFKSMQYHDVINVTIETDLDSLINVRKRETYQPAQFTYENNQGEKITQSIKVKPRGKYRRRVCDFPTIKLNFKKKALKEDGMAKYDDYKVVTHCLNDKKISKENVTREYLIYKMYNLLSENSYQVQLVNITLTMRVMVKQGKVILPIMITAPRHRVIPRHQYQMLLVIKVFILVVISKKHIHQQLMLVDRQQPQTRVQHISKLKQI